MYVETNSAYAEYMLDNTPEQQYGIYHFLNEASGYEMLRTSVYYELENLAMRRNFYLGSPGLAMNILGDTVGKYLFFDIEDEPLKNIQKFALEKDLPNKVDVRNQDSVSGVMTLLPSLPASAFLHIDPYEIDKENNEGDTYLDLFIQATLSGMKCLLWYGFMTLDIKSKLNDYIKNKLKQNDINDSVCVELILEIIEKETITCNPGILGSGLLATNISEQSKSAILNYSELLIDTYKGVKYNGYKGDLYRDIVL